MIRCFPIFRTLAACLFFAFTTGPAYSQDVLSSSELDYYAFQKYLYLNGELQSEADLIRYIETAAMIGVPIEAANVLEKELGTSRISTKPERYAELALLYWQSREYELGEIALRKALNSADQESKFIRRQDIDRIERPLERMFFDRKCDLMEQVIGAMDLKAQDKPLVLLGRCLWEQANSLEKIDQCQFFSQEHFLQSTRGKAMNRAMQVFSLIPPESLEYETAKKYERFIQSSIEASDDPGGSICSHRRARMWFKNMKSDKDQP